MLSRLRQALSHLIGGEQRSPPASLGLLRRVDDFVPDAPPSIAEHEIDTAVEAFLTAARNDNYKHYTWQDLVSNLATETQTLREEHARLAEQLPKYQTRCPDLYKI